MFDAIFSDYQWYRKFRKGTWRLVRVKVLPSAIWVWIRREPKEWEYVCEVEQW